MLNADDNKNIFKRYIKESSHQAMSPKADLRGSSFDKKSNEFRFHHEKTPSITVKQNITAPDFDIPAGTKLRPLPSEPGVFKFEVVSSPDQSLVGEISTILMSEILG